MPTNNKTANIGLNAWVATDKPKRADFVADNELIDGVLSGHLNDSNMHLSSTQRNRISAPFVAGAYTGDGTAQGVLLLDFTPALVLFARQSKPVFTQSGGETVVSGGFAVPFAGSGGITFNGNRVYLTQTQGAAQDGVRYELNQQYGNYFYIAYK